MSEGIEGARIVIAEDDEGNVLLLRMLLENAGYTNLRTTTDPRELLVSIEEVTPDILLLDLHMPHMSGIQVMERIRALTGEDHSFPILVLSGDTNPRTRDRVMALGASDFLVKPFDLNAVLESIGSRLRGHLDRASTDPPGGETAP